MDEDIEEFISPENVDLSSFTIQKELNPKFWKDNLIDSRVRMRLLDIADDFIEFLNVDWVEPEDIVLTGSIANFNWNNKFSDVDIHIIYDFSKIDENTDFVSEYFYSKKKLWNEEHNGINIFGLKVELYVEDVNNKACSTGVYSLESNDWVEKPNRKVLTNSKVNKKLIKKLVSDYTKKIDYLHDLFMNNKSDTYVLRKVNKKANKLFDEIKQVRKNALNKNKKEITNGNIVFKTLRRFGYIEKLANIVSDTYDKYNSLN